MLNEVHPFMAEMKKKMVCTTSCPDSPDTCFAGNSSGEFFVLVEFIASRREIRKQVRKFMGTNLIRSKQDNAGGHHFS